MEEISVEGIKRKLKKLTHPDIIQDAVIFEEEEKDFMQSYIKKLEEETNNYFKSPICTRKDYYYYACERSSKATGNSKGPTKTRANSCMAYVCFNIIKDAGYTGAVVHNMLKHSGHDAGIQEEGVKYRVDPELQAFIDMWLEQGLSVSETLLKSVDWTEQHGHMDKHNRRYYVTPEDIRTIKKSINAFIFPDVKDCVSVDILATSELKENICFYQPLSDEKPLIIVVQTPWQKQLLKEHPHPMMFMDATYKSMTSYGYAFYALLLTNSIGRGVPFAYFIISQESIATLSLCLAKLSSHNPGFFPRSVMIDRDLKELNAIKQIFPSAKVLVCWFHVLQAVHRWLVKRDGGNLSVEQRNMVIQAMVAMKMCSSEEEFNNTSETKCKELDSYLGSARVSTYLKSQWISCGELWSSFGRLFNHENSETNNKAERFFLTMKYQFLKGNANRRIDQLLRLLCGDVQKYYCYMDDLADIGQIKGINTDDFSNAVQSMIEKGLDSKLKITETGTCFVPPDMSAQCHRVDLVMVKCDCRKSKSGCVCKHIVFSRAVVQQQWSQSDKYTENRELYKMVERAHKLIFSNFSIQSRKRKITALQVYRQQVKKAKSGAVTANYICRQKSRVKQRKNKN